MPVDYSKWDMLELSDDSDTEVHPNIDKKSWIRWKQSDIHAKRAERDAKILQLEEEIELNFKLKTRVDHLRQRCEDEMGGAKHAFGQEYERLQEIVKRDGSERKDGKGPTEDDMILHLLMTIRSELDGIDQKLDESGFDRLIGTTLHDHASKLALRSDQCRAEIESLEREKKKHITSDDLKEGFSSGHVSKADESSKRNTPKTKTKQIEKSIETISSGKTTEISSHNSLDGSIATSAMDQDTDNEVPTMTPSMRAFASIRIGDYRASKEAISKDRDLLDTETTDALLMEAFTAEMAGRHEEARTCVHQGLLIQYCQKLGQDGVNLFFRRVSVAGSQGEKVFLDDVASTYQRIAQRSLVLKDEQGTESSGQGVAQIQLQATDPGSTISFEIPQPPPASPREIQVQLEDGSLATSEQQEEAFEYFTSRWQVWQSFPPSFRQALETKNLEIINKVLGKMDVEQAEDIVNQLSQFGILNMEEGVRDMTNQST